MKKWKYLLEENESKDRQYETEFDRVSYTSIKKERISEGGEYNLSYERYIAGIKKISKKFNMVFLGEIADLLRGITFGKGDRRLEETPDTLRVVTTKAAQENGISEKDLYFIPRKLLKNYELLLKNGDILISTANSLGLLGRTTFVNNISYDVSFGAFMSLIRPSIKSVDPIYLLQCLRSSNARSYFLSYAKTTTNISNITFSDLSSFSLPLPPLDVQREIVDEIESYQRIIDGARQVVDNWKPNLEHELELARKKAGVKEWEEVKLGDVCRFIRGPFGGSLKKEIFKPDGYLVYEQYHAIKNDFNFGRYYISEEKFIEMQRFEVLSGDILISCSGTMGKVAIVPQEHRRGIINQALLKLTPNAEIINTKFLKHILESEFIQMKHFRNQSGVAIQNVASVNILKEIRFPIPPFETQTYLADKIEVESNIVESNRKLIEIYEEKIRQVIARVWEG